MGQLKNRLIDWWRRQQRTVPSIDIVEYYERQSEVPVSIPRHKLILIGKGEHLKWAMFECPCGTGHKIMINLSSSRDPHWRVVFDGGQPSLLPSVNYNDEFGRCHFWLRAGRVEFTPDSKRPRRRRATNGGHA
jgi:hypothetical protein